jgi:hypothetical protein
MNKQQKIEKIAKYLEEESFKKMKIMSRRTVNPNKCYEMWYQQNQPHTFIERAEKVYEQGYVKDEIGIMFVRDICKEENEEVCLDEDLKPLCVNDINYHCDGCQKCMED